MKSYGKHSHRETVYEVKVKLTTIRRNKTRLLSTEDKSKKGNHL